VGGLKKSHGVKLSLLLVPRDSLNFAHAFGDKQGRALQMVGGYSVRAAGTPSAHRQASSQSVIQIGNLLIPAKREKKCYNKQSQFLPSSLPPSLSFLCSGYSIALFNQLPFVVGYLFSRVQVSLSRNHLLQASENDGPTTPPRQSRHRAGNKHH
jgi:hypothetical protein